MTEADIHKTIETIFRIEQGRLIGGLVRLVRDVGRAEDLAQEALVAAFSAWPKAGVPDNPGAWLMATAKRRAIDGFRREAMQARKHAELAHDLEDADDGTEAIEAAMDDDIGDDQLALIFTACHPVLSPDARAALTLKLIGGLTTDEIARAFLSTEPAIAQRIVRAKKALGAAGLSYEVPHGKERTERLASVLEVLYLIFNEGYAATSGDDLIRPGLCAEALRLGRVLAAALPNEPEVYGLMALMELQASRLGTRTASDGTPIPLTEQNRALWDQLLVRRGLNALGRAQALGGGRGAYALQAALAACHARAKTAVETDWRQIAAIYDALLDVMPTPVVALNRAVAHSMAEGPEAGLALLAEIEDAPALKAYAPLAAARGDFLFRAGRFEDARAAFEHAAGLSRNAGEKAFLMKRALACGQPAK
ncbi:RNA polymerase sigma factor [Kordiimonas marina]|uniref:RNA polymerase sigma factor n=1 Tax=Kordiimonas marina TaxID=2872312 RepID=UPI001FF2D1DE|nr:RNA polymerase sigma factor [Kordiimonas marina]MCJ9427990.1 RNA polymerase sigma factor [Kordiimonas marina]